MSTSTSPPTDRVVDVLERLAERPGGLRLADLTRELDLTKGTAHAIMTTLCDRGWVTRDQVEKTFTLGPALTIAAAKADLVRPLALAARACAVELAEALGHAVTVVEQVGDSIVILAFEGGDAEILATPGDRVPFGAPIGLGFAAWGPEPVRRGWIERGAGDDATLARRLEELTEVTRQRGYTVERMNATYAQTAQLMAMLRDDQLPDGVRRAINSTLADLTRIVLQADHTVAVTAIAAPVFDDRHRVALNLAVHPNGSMSTAQIAAIGRRLTAETGRVSRSTMPSEVAS